MKECPRCQSQQIIKSGLVNKRQGYKCKACSYHYTVSQKSDTSNPSQRRLALTLYLEGLGFRSIGRILEFSHVAVYHWIKSFGEQIEAVKQKETTIVEIDDMHSYVGHKKTIAGSGLGKRFIHVVTGTRGIKTGQKLWNEIANQESMERIATDHWKAYEVFIPQDKHIQSKAETFTVEGYSTFSSTTQKEVKMLE